MQKIIVLDWINNKYIMLGTAKKNGIVCYEHHHIYNYISCSNKIILTLYIYMNLLLVTINNNIVAIATMHYIC